MAKNKQANGQNRDIDTILGRKKNKSDKTVANLPQTARGEERLLQLFREKEKKKGEEGLLQLFREKEKKKTQQTNGTLTGRKPQKIDTAKNVIAEPQQVTDSETARRASWDLFDSSKRWAISDAYTGKNRQQAEVTQGPEMPASEPAQPKTAEDISKESYQTILGNIGADVTGKTQKPTAADARTNIAQPGKTTGGNMAGDILKGSAKQAGTQTGAQMPEKGAQASNNVSQDSYNKILSNITGKPADAKSQPAGGEVTMPEAQQPVQQPQAPVQQPAQVQQPVTRPQAQMSYSERLKQVLGEDARKEDFGAAQKAGESLLDTLKKVTKQGQYIPTDDKRLRQIKAGTGTSKRQEFYNMMNGIRQKQYEENNLKNKQDVAQYENWLWHTNSAELASKQDRDYKRQAVLREKQSTEDQIAAIGTESLGISNRITGYQDYMKTPQGIVRMYYDRGDLEGINATIRRYPEVFEKYDLPEYVDWMALNPLGGNLIDIIAPSVGSLDGEKRKDELKSRLKYYDQMLAELDEADAKWEPINKYETEMAGKDAAYRPEEVIQSAKGYDPNLAGNTDLRSYEGEYGVNEITNELEQAYEVAALRDKYKAEGRYDIPAIYMDDTQASTFMALMNEGRIEEAQAYYDAIKQSLNDQWTKHYIERAKALAESGSGSEYTTGIASIGFSFLGGFMGAEGLIRSLAGDKEAQDPNSRFYLATNISKAIREQSGENTGRKLEKVFGKPGYEAGKYLNSVKWSIYDNLFAVAAGGGVIGGAETASEALTLLTLSTQAGSNQFIENRNNNMDPVMASLMAIGSMLIEAGSEKMGFDAIFKPKASEFMGSAMQFAKFMAKSGAAEAGEEGVSSVANMIMDQAAATFTDHETDIERSAQEYIDRKKAESNYQYTSADVRRWRAEGRQEAWGGFWKETAMDMLSGFLSSVPMAGGRGIANIGSMNAVGADIMNSGPQTAQDSGSIFRKTTSSENVDYLINIGKSMNTDTNSYQFADKLAKRKASGKKISNFDLGRLATNLEYETSEQMGQDAKDAVVSVITGQLREQGVESGKAQALAGLVYKAKTQGINALNKREVKELSDNVPASQIYMEMTEKGDQDVTAAVSEAAQKAAKAAKTAAFSATEESREKLDAARSIISGKGGYTINEKLIGEDTLKEARKSVGTASEETINMMGGREAIGTAASTVITYTSDQKNGTDAKAGKVVGFKDGKLQVQYADGTQADVNPANVETTDGNAQGIIGYMRTNKGFMSDDVATKAMVSLDALGEEAAPKFAEDIIKINMAARLGREMPTKGISIREDIAKEIYNTAHDEYEKAQQERIEEGGELTPGKGKLHDGEVRYGTKEWTEKYKNLSKEQKDQLYIANRFAEVFGFDIKAFSADVLTDKKGRRTQQQGWQSGSGIGLNINGKILMMDGPDIARNMLNALGHEAPHWLQKHSIEGYNELRNYALNELEKSGNYNLEQEIKKKIDLYNRFYQQTNEIDPKTKQIRQATIDDAIYEIVSDACDQMFSSKEFEQRLLAEAPKAHSAIKEFVRNMVARLKNALKGISASGSKESETIRMFGGIKAIDELARIWLGGYDNVIHKAVLQQETGIPEPATHAETVGGKTYSAEQINDSTKMLEDAKSEPKEHFSLTAPVEMRKDGMIAVHNLNVEDLLRDAQMGGFPMPSIAVLPNSATWEDYGNTSIFFGEDSVDFNDGTVYSGDAYTPTMGRYEAKSAEDALEFLRKQRARNPYQSYSAVNLFRDFRKITNIDEARAKTQESLKDRSERVAYNKKMTALEKDIMQSVAEYRNRQEHTRYYTIQLETSPYNYPLAYGMLLAAEEMAGKTNLTTAEKYEILQKCYDQAMKEGLSSQVDLSKEGTEIYDKMLEFIDGAMNLPSIFIESKPNRILGFDAIKAIVMPESAGQEAIQALIDAGIDAGKIRTYQMDVAGARTEALKSVPKNVAGTSFSVTQQQNAEYMKAVESGDKDLQQYYVNNAAERAGFTETGYHGSPTSGFTKFDLGKMQNSIFVAFNKEISETYTTNGKTREINDMVLKEKDLQKMSNQQLVDLAKDRTHLKTWDSVYVDDNGKFHIIAKDETGEEVNNKVLTRNQFIEEIIFQTDQNNIYELFVRPGKQLVVDADNNQWDEIPFDLYGTKISPNWDFSENIEYTDTEWDENFDPDGPHSMIADTREIAKWAKAHGYDSVRINNVYDSGTWGKEGYGDIGIFFNPEDVKSADPVVYDDNGNVIPLSERFNKKEQDIRYSITQQQDTQEKELYAAADQAHENVRALREEYKAMKPEYDAWVNKITEAEDPDSMMEEYKEWEKGYRQKYDELYDAEQVYKDAQRKYDEYIEKKNVAEEQEKIKQSGMTEADWRRNEAKKEFGYTTNFREAGYLLPDGKMLNFSGEKGKHNGHRYEDNRRIGTIYASNEIQGGAAMNAFMKDGNIRVMAETPGIDISTVREPTSEQYNQIRNMVRQMAEEEYFSVDLTDERGYNAGNLEYEGRLNPQRVVNDIKTYFKTGEVPAENLLNRFYSLTTQHPDNLDVMVWMESVPESSLATEAEKELLRQYKGMRTALGLDDIKISELTRKIRTLEEKGELNQEEKRMLDNLKIRLQNAKTTQAIHSEKMVRATEADGFARMIRDQQRLMNDLTSGKTLEEVQESVERMEETAGRTKAEIEAQAKELAQLAKDKGVQEIQSRIHKVSLDRMAKWLRKTYVSNINKQELMDGLAGIALKLNDGQDISQDVEDLAGRIIETMPKEYGENLEKLRGLTLELGKEQVKELKATNSSLKEIRSLLAGTGIRIVQTEKSGLDRIWNEICDMVPTLDRNASDKDQLNEILDLVQSEKQNAEKGLNKKYQEELANLMEDIQSAALAVDVDMVTDPKAKKQIEKLQSIILDLSGRTEEAAQKMAEMSARMDELIAKGRKAAGWTAAMKHDLQSTIDYFDKTAKLAVKQAKQNKQDAIIQQLKDENNQKMMKANDEWRALIQRDADARRQAERNSLERKKMTVVASRLAKLLSNPTNTKNIPEVMNPLARKLVETLVNADLSDSGRKIMNVPKKNMMDIKRRLDAWNERDGVYNPDEIADENIRDIVNNDLEEIEDAIKEWNGRYNGKNKLDTLQLMGKTLERMREAVGEIYTIIQNQREISLGDRRVAIEDQAEKVRYQTFGKKKKEWIGKAGRTIAAMHKAIVSGNMTPEYFFRTLGNSGLNDLWEEYHSAENRNGLELHKAQQKIDAIAQKYGYDQWDTDKRTDIELEKGGTVSLTLGQMMSLMATWNREQTLGPEMSNHLEKGGFYAETQNIADGLLGKTTIEKKAHRVTAQDIAKIESILTEQQKNFVDEIVRFMSNDLSKLGNEASMKAYGIKMYKEKYYFPFQMWDGIKSKKSNDSGSAASRDRAFHPSFSKSRMHGANNALVIGDFMKTATDHAIGMINYATMGLANDTFQKVLNQKVTEGTNEEDLTKRNVRAVLEEAYGMEAMDYLRDLQDHMNGGAVATRKTIGDKLISLFRKNAVAGSLSVAMQQPLSYLRAALMINPKYLAGALVKDFKGSYKEMLEHSGVAVIKNMGRFDMGFGQSAREYLMPQGKQSLGRKIWEQVKDKSTFLPEIMDNATWTRIWTAVKSEQHDIHPEMDTKSDEFLDMCAVRFNDIIRRTQVYDSTLVKSRNMRSDNYLIKGMTSFMGEPTLTLNVLADAARQVKKGDKGAIGRMAGAGAVYIMGAILQAAFKGVMGAGRSPDDKKTFMENFMYKFGYNFINEINPVSQIPGYGDLIDQLKKGEVNDDALAMIGKITKAGGTGIDMLLGNAELDYRNIEDSVGQIVQLFSGVPAKNIMRDARAIYNFITQPYAKRETSEAVLKYQTIDQIMNADNMMGVLNKWMIDRKIGGYGTSTTDYYGRIYDAKKAGDTQKAKEMEEYLTSAKGVKEETVASKVKTLAQKDERSSAAETAQFMADEGMDPNSYILEQVKKGNMSAEEAEKQMLAANPDADKKEKNEIFWKVDRAKYTQETGKDASGMYYRFKDAIVEKDMDTFYEQAELILEHGGNTDYEGECVTDAFRDGKIDRDTATEMMRYVYNKDEKSDDDIWWTLDRIEYQQETGAEKVTGNYYRLYDAMDANSADAIGNAVNTMVQHGMKKEDIKKQIGKKYKQAYLEADNNGKRKIRDAMQKAYKKLGYKAEDADKTIKNWTK